MTELQVRYQHELFGHAGKSLLSALLNKIWIVGGKLKLIKSVIKNCVVCARLNSQSHSQLMGQLPAVRVNVAMMPFTYCGVDFTGPLTTKCVGHRSIRCYKAYICIFVCLTTRAVYIEVTSDLSPDGFIGALAKFISRRGCPKVMYSDNGTNFRGAANLLAAKKLYLMMFNSIKTKFKSLLHDTSLTGSLYFPALRTMTEFGRAL